MITIIVGTNRRNNGASSFAREYQRELESMYTGQVKLLDLSMIPHDWFHPDMYVSEQQSPSLRVVQDEYIIPAERFVYVIPEYNGGFSGALKVFLDGCSVREYQTTFKGKKALLAGVATGRAGNLRGMDHLTGVLNHVGTVVMPAKEPYSQIGGLIDDQGNITDEITLKRIRNHASDFLAF